MEFQNILNLLQTVFSLIVAGIALYLKFSTNAQTKAKEVQEVIAEVTARAVIYIREAEENYNYFMSISIDDIIDDIFNQLGGNSLQEKAIQEAKEKIKKECASYRNNKIVTVKSNIISLILILIYLRL